jgi:hypothetical protein
LRFYSFQKRAIRIPADLQLTGAIMIGKAVVAIVIVEAAARHLLSNELLAARSTIQTAHLLARLVLPRFVLANRDMLGTLIAMGMAWGANRFVPSLNASGDAGCTAGLIRAHPKAIVTHGSMADTRLKQKRLFDF